MVDNETISKKKSEKLLKIKIGQNLYFNKHAISLCKKRFKNYTQSLGLYFQYNLTKEEINQITIADLSFSTLVHAVPKITTVHISNA